MDDQSRIGSPTLSSGSMSKSTAELQVTTIVDALAGALRENVLTGHWAPGARVTEQDVAQKFGVSRPTAKAAIERVAQTGVLRRSANKTARVPLLEDADIVDLYRSRVVLETSVVESLALAKRAPQQADTALADMLRAIENSSFTAFAEADILYHRSLVEELGSPRILRMYETVIGEAHLCIVQEQNRSDDVRMLKYHEHVEILDTIRNGDSDRAPSLMRTHLENAVSRLTGIPIDIDHWE